MITSILNKQEILIYKKIEQLQIIQKTIKVLNVTIWTLILASCIYKKKIESHMIESYKEVLIIS